MAPASPLVLGLRTEPAGTSGAAVAFLFERSGVTRLPRLGFPPEHPPSEPPPPSKESLRGETHPHRRSLIRLAALVDAAVPGGRIARTTGLPVRPSGHARPNGIFLRALARRHRPCRPLGCARHGRRRSPRSRTDTGLRPRPRMASKGRGGEQAARGYEASARNLSIVPRRSFFSCCESLSTLRRRRKKRRSIVSSVSVMFLTARISSGVVLRT